MNLHDQLYQAAEKKNHDAVIGLINKYGKQAFLDEEKPGVNALDAAVRNNDLACVQALLEIYDPWDENSYVLLLAAGRGYTDMLEFLMPLCNPSDYLLALGQTIIYTHNPCFDILFAKTDASSSEASQMLQWATYYNNQHVFDAVYPLADPHVALAQMREEKYSLKQMKMLCDRIYMEEEKALLQKEVHNKGRSSLSKKI